MNNYIGYLKRITLATVSVCGMLIGEAHAQLNPFQSMYYQNHYLLNPALAGVDKGLNLNVNYRQQWSNFPGTPKTAAFTADFNAGDRVGVGANVQDDQSGLIRTTRAVGSYAYHLPLNDAGDHLSFGLSLGINNSRVDANKVNGDMSDQELLQYNQLKPYVDGDFGAAYTSSHWLVSAAVPNLKSTLFKGSDSRYDADLLTFSGIVAYKFTQIDDGNSFTMSPLAGYRMVKGFKDIFDAGFNITMNNYGLYFQSIYHTNQNISMGIGLDQKTYMLNFAYNLETGQLSNYTRGAFEFGLKINVFNSPAK
ncbi:type IX secretion system PorP/SprF family membrane protein [Mucilaginibacter yixingensis]|uniref:Type IX secretion system PorP/SprF family membrane protein n=1 Tax=Mucilaginibacter yixingensis TaxID=1295612 RepID=A0A2T5JG49_9SPHI|nr:PorP/SprF family type IX secretion system membrane protein [Mucilaginibacter yixingensis]PTR01410.1 type IX secretion system PorP/SprF family membrane protein [Mucilaginibacter yixingensis]